MRTNLADDPTCTVGLGPRPAEAIAVTARDLDLDAGLVESAAALRP